MVQAVSSDYGYYLATSQKSNSVPAMKQSQSEKDAQGCQNTKTDVVEISIKARTAMQTPDSIVSVGGKSSSQYYATAEQRTSFKPVAVRDSSAKQNTSSKAASEESSPELSELSEAQMDCLVVKGTITKKDERLEFARRAEKEQSAAKEKAVIQAKRERAKSYRYPSCSNGTVATSKIIQGHAT